MFFSTKTMCSPIGVGVSVAAIGLFLLTSSFVFSQTLPQVIYGEDDRRDLSQTDDVQLLELARSTAVLVWQKDILVGDGDDLVYQLDTEPLYERVSNLCPDEPFRNQPTIGFCSGFLASEDILVSAGHCFQRRSACKKAAVVFDFSYRSPDTDITLVKRRNIFKCKKIIKRVYDIGSGLDFAVIRLDRPVKDRTPLKLQTTETVKVGESLTVIGHPLGLPAKVSSGTVTKSEPKSGFFVTNTDTYTGSSGSAVLNSRTGLVEGIAVRGEDDFSSTANECNSSKVCPEDGCRGEDVVKAAVFAEWI